MDSTTRIGAPSCFPRNPDSFLYLSSHIKELLDFSTFQAHSASFKFPVGRHKNWNIITQIQRGVDDTYTDGGDQTGRTDSTGAGSTVYNFAWGVEYIQEQKTETATSSSSSSSPASSPSSLSPSAPDSVAASISPSTPSTSTSTSLSSSSSSSSSDVVGVKPKILRAEKGTIVQALVQNDGTFDGVVWHRLNKWFSFKTYGLYNPAPQSSLAGINFRVDGPSWNGEVKLGTDGGTVGFNAAYAPFENTVVGLDGFYVEAEKGSIITLGVKQNFGLAQWAKPATYSFHATSLGRIINACSAPITRWSRAGTRFTYDLGTRESYFEIGAEMYLFRHLFPNNTSTWRHAKLQAMFDPQRRYAVAVSVPVSKSLVLNTSVNKQWNLASSDLPNFSIGLVYD